MAAPQIDRIIAGCTIGGVVAAFALVVGPVAGAPEHLITGTVLLTFGVGWALVALLSTAWADQPQRWAVGLASFMGLVGVALVVLAPNDTVLDALGWVWPPLFFALLIGTIVRVHRDLHGRARVWVVYPMLGVYALCALGGGYETIREALDRRIVAPGQLVDVGGYRLHLRCAGSGTPTVVLESGLGEASAYWAWISPAIARDTKVCVYDRPGRGRSDPSSVAQDGGAVAEDLHTGNRPLVVVTAAQDAQAGWLPLQDRLARLSTNSSHRVVAATHIALVTEQNAAQTSTQAIRDVVHAVRTNASLDKSPLTTN